MEDYALYQSIRESFEKLLTKNPKVANQLMLMCKDPNYKISNKSFEVLEENLITVHDFDIVREALTPYWIQKKVALKEPVPKTKVIKFVPKNKGKQEL